MSRLPDNPIIYCISEGLADGGNFAQTRERIAARIRVGRRGGVNLFQIREKKLPASLLFDLAAEAVAAARDSGVKLLINGRADIALAAGADGVHLPADGVPAAELRRAFPPGMIVGVSTHTLKEAIAAREAGADLVTFGPVFSSPGKGEGIGLRCLAEVCERLAPFPVIALGGVDEHKAAAVIENGAAGFAAIRYLNECLELGKTAGF